MSNGSILSLIQINMSSSSDNESYDSDGGSSIHAATSADVRFPLPYFEPRDNVYLTYVDVDICLGELYVLPLNRPDKKRILVDNEEDNIFLRERWNERHWAMLGRDVAGNDHLSHIEIGVPDRSVISALSDQNMKAFFQGLTRSNSMRSMTFYGRGFGMEGLHAMIPFLKNASNLTTLNINQNEIGSEGFSLLWNTLRDSPIEKLWCGWCGVDSLEIDENCIPKCLKDLKLSGGNINSDGCRELTKLILKEDSTLRGLYIRENNIDDEGVAILVGALRNNTSVERLSLDSNEGISTKGEAMLLRLVNDISSIEATLKSNHTLIELGPSYEPLWRDEDPDDIMKNKISAALEINRSSHRKKDAGRWKVVSTQLNSEERASLCHLQEVELCNEALYSEINPLHLPEVLEMVGCNHGHGELYVALRSSIAGLFSTINRKKFLQECVEHHLSIMQTHAATVETLRAQIAAIEEAEGNVLETENESRSVGFKRPRTC
jgi:hypothetical protein